jgi:hypothetical protein
VGHDIFQGAFNMLATFTVKGRYDHARVRDSLTCLHRNHQILRCTIIQRGGAYRFVEADNFASVPIRFERVGSPEEAKAFIETEVDTTFDYARYVWRFSLLEQPDDTTTFVFSLNHAMGDGVVLLGFCREFFDTYLDLQQGREPERGDFRFERDLEDVLQSAHVAAPHDVKMKDDAVRAIRITHADPADRHTRINTLRLDRKHESDILQTCHKRGITFNSYLAGGILRALAEQIDPDIAVVLNTPFNVISQHLVERHPHEDFGYGVGIVVQQFDRILKRDFFELAETYGQELKDRIASYKIPKTADDNLQSARDYIIEELERPKRGEMPIEVMLSNVGRFEVPREFAAQVENTYITGGRRSGDQIFLIVPVSINGELFIPIAYTEPFFDARFARDFQARLQNSLSRFST